MLADTPNILPIGRSENRVNGGIQTAWMIGICCFISQGVTNRKYPNILSNSILFKSLMPKGYLMAKNPSKHRYFCTVLISSNPARLSISTLAWEENGSSIPFKLRLLEIISSDV